MTQPTAFRNRCDMALAAARRCGSRLWVLQAAVLLWVAAAAWAATVPSPSAPQTQVIHDATLVSPSGQRFVRLPHALAAADFAPAGSTVRYRLEWPLQQVPDRTQAAYVSKLSLSGQLFVNGQLVDVCGNAPLPELRCLHQPLLFKIPPVLLQAGTNVLEFEVYATPRQMNGLSAVQLGDAAYLHDEVYIWRHFLTVDLQVGLTWLSTLLGLLSITVGAVLRQERVFIWFGLTSMVNALASLNGVVTHPTIDIDIYNWLIFWSRLVSVPLAFLTLLAIFDKDGPRVRWMLLGYSLLVPAIIWFSQNNRVVTFGLYAPLVFACPFLLFMTVRWTLKSRNLIQATSTLMMLILFSGGLIDWMRLGGQTRFDGVYLSVYTYSGMLVTIGLLLVSRLAAALLQSQKMGVLLERQVTERIAYEVTENIPVGTFTIMVGPRRRQARFSFMSRRFLQITGLHQDGEGAHLRQFLAIVHPDDRPALLGHYRSALAHQQPFSARLRIRVSGQTRWIHVESAPRKRADGSTVWEGVLIDETEQVLTREAAERDRAALQDHLLAQSRLQEREQLLRDVHDGFGSQLASVRMMVEKGRIGPQELPGYLQEVSADLHLVVDTLGQGDITLEEAIYDMRYRTERRLGSSGIVFHWQIELSGLPALAPRVILQILRIVQEAMHNALRHAQARNITVTARYDPSDDCLSVRVQDDGIGLPEALRSGRGLSNMRHRAREIGAQLTVRSEHLGTLVALQFDRLHAMLSNSTH